MPWKASSVVEERLRFVGRLLDGESMSDACRQFGMIDSLCTSSSSIWKHWDLFFGIGSTGVTVSFERSNDPFVFQLGRTDLVWSIRNDLLALEDTGLDELANLMAADTELCGGVAQC